MNRAFLLITALLFIICACKKKNDSGIIRANKHMLLVLDAAHGGADTGSKADNGKMEKILALEVCKKMAAIAPEYNIEVLQTRTEDKYMDPEERKSIANAVNADAFVSVHINRSAAGTPPRPYEVFVAPGVAREVESKALARFVLARLKQAGKDTLVTERSALVLNTNKHPAIVLECGDIALPADVATMENENELCRYVLSGVVAFRNSK